MPLGGYRGAFRLLDALFHKYVSDASSKYVTGPPLARLLRDKHKKIHQIYTMQWKRDYRSEMGPISSFSN